MSGNTTFTSHLYDSASGHPKEFCDFICRYERFHECVILTCGRTLVFRRQTDIGKSLAPCGIWSLSTDGCRPLVRATRDSARQWQRVKPDRETNPLADMDCEKGADVG